MPWKLELVGRASDLEELPKLVTAPELRVVESDGHHYLEGEQFNSLDSSAVYTAALELLPRLNGAAKLEVPGFQGVTIGAIQELDEDGKVRQHVVGIGDVIGQPPELFGLGIVQDGQSPAPPTPGSSEADRSMRAAHTNPEVARALELWDAAHDPFHLWKVWERVRVKSGLTFDTDLVRRFRPALNDRAIAGEEARHDESRQYPVEKDTMTVAEAEAFLGDLLRRWLRSFS